MGLLDFIFPKYCVNCKKLGSYICSDCFSYLSFNVSEICLACNRQSIDGLTHPPCRGKYVIDGAFSSIAYKGVAKKLIYNFKFDPHYISDLRHFLTDLFYEGLIQKEEFNKALEEKPILVPIPLHKSKLKSRGYNQAEILAKELVKRLDPFPVKGGTRMTVENVLERVKNTKSQVGLKKEERKENIKDAFSLLPNILISLPADATHQALQAGQYPAILLLDDVLTTGSTLLEAARVLKKSGVKKVYGLTLAKD